MADSEIDNISKEEELEQEELEKIGTKNKKLLIIKISVVVLILLFLAGGLYFFFAEEKESSGAMVEDAISKESSDGSELIEDEIVDTEAEPFEIEIGDEPDLISDTKLLDDEEELLEEEIIEEDLQVEDTVFSEASEDVLDSPPSSALEKENERLKQELIDLKSQHETNINIVEPNLEGYYFDELPDFKKNEGATHEPREGTGLEPKWGEFKRVE